MSDIFEKIEKLELALIDLKIPYTIRENKIIAHKMFKPTIAQIARKIGLKPCT